MIPLRSYGQPPTDDEFNGLDYFDLRLNNVSYLNILNINLNYFILVYCSIN